MRETLVIVVLSILLYSLSSLFQHINVGRLSSVEYQVEGPTHVVDFINSHKQLAIEVSARDGVPVSMIFGQAGVESNFGTSPLARRSNNCYGIHCHVKSHRSYKGKTAHCVPCEPGGTHRCVRYASIEESIRDHSNFLRRNNRYKSLFNYGRMDYKSWARGVKDAGYATHPRYATMVIDKIEEYKLYRFDEPTLLPSRFLMKLSQWTFVLSIILMLIVVLRLWRNYKLGKQEKITFEVILVYLRDLFLLGGIIVIWVCTLVGRTVGYFFVNEKKKETYRFFPQKSFNTKLWQLIPINKLDKPNTKKASTYSKKHKRR